jgi:hypothetical protein
VGLVERKAKRAGLKAGRYNGKNKARAGLKPYIRKEAAIGVSR